MDTETSNTDKYLQLLKESIKSDPIASFLNMQVIELRPGYSKVSLQLLPEYQNFNGFVFGGIIMAIA
ncbi:MAG: PaaI family thioesterase, partial [Dehalococcoidales bacterium]|nr:PaaI family thioesterase [Dehalococcoidales bacterium]